MQQVLAKAIVDVLWNALGDNPARFVVSVWGEPPYNVTRIYEIDAESDTIAAQDGIRRFVAEMEAAPQTKV
jgi:hypothetical protein